MGCFRNSACHMVLAAALGVIISLSIFWQSLNCNAQEAANVETSNLGGENVAEMLGLGKDVLEYRMKIVMQKIDIDGDGKLTEKEFRAWLIKIRTAMQQKQVAVEVQAIDKDQNGLITIEELKTAYGATGDPSDEQIMEVETRFKIVDKNKDGSLDKDELALLMEPSGDPELLKLETEEILSAQDRDKDGKITILEFSEGEGAGDDQQELEKEFKMYDVNGDGVIDRAEIERVIADPHQHEVDSALKEVGEHMKDGTMDAEAWAQNVEKLAISAITDQGELLRLPEDYPALELPFSNVEKEAEEEREEL